MGADMIGYTLVRPAKGADKIAKKQLSKIETILSNEKLTAFQRVQKLYKAGVELDYTGDDLSSEECLEAIEGLVELIDLEVHGRDLMSRIATVRGRKIEILSAGEMSWGDEPDGEAYNLLKAYVQLGISDAWERSIK